MQRSLTLLIPLTVFAVFIAGCGKKKTNVARSPRAPSPTAAAPPAGTVERGLASWYGHPYHGRPAADGEIYDMEQLVAAHRTLPFQTMVRVRNMATGQTVDVRIIDRGPFVGGRIIDLSHAAAVEIGLIGTGCRPGRGHCDRPARESGSRAFRRPGGRIRRESKRRPRCAKHDHGIWGREGGSARRRHAGLARSGRARELSRRRPNRSPSAFAKSSTSLRRLSFVWTPENRRVRSFPASRTEYIKMTATGMVGRAPAILQIRAQIEKLAVRRSTVLIQGESGTGKEIVARSIYNADPRGHFVPIDCASLVGTMMESELFGHVRGAFTGASENKRGLIELAQGGTAFFDEIGELPLELQAKLLRVLQERELRPLGSLQRIQIDVRVIAATNRDLQREVAAGRFREDLFHRLNVVRLTLPPLRERREDIPLLIERFLERAPGRFSLTHDAAEAMMNYDWPGNVRELMNCLERMMSFNSGPLLHFADLPTGIANHARAGSAAGFVSFAAVVGGQAAPPARSVVPLHEMEKLAIRRALEHTGGDRTLAAQMLGIGRTTLYRRLKEYQLEIATSNNDLE